jgi:hypothetical protein
MKDIVQSATFMIHSTNVEDSDSDSESDASSASGEYRIDDIIEDLKTDIQCLVDLGPRFKEPIRDRALIEEAALPSQGATWNPAECLASRIRHRYPNSDADFTRILGQTNWDRARELYALKETNTRKVQRPAAKPELDPGLPRSVVASDFRDSGVGTSVATPSSYAETVLSYHGTKGGAVKIPQVPSEGPMGKPFPCDICGHMCQLPVANWKSFWKYGAPFYSLGIITIIQSGANHWATENMSSLISSHMFALFQVAASAGPHSRRRRPGCTTSSWNMALPTSQRTCHAPFAKKLSKAERHLIWRGIWRRSP